jgi:hypothetical protein
MQIQSKASKGCHRSRSCCEFSVVAVSGCCRRGSQLAIQSIDTRAVKSQTRRRQLLRTTRCKRTTARTRSAIGTGQKDRRQAVRPLGMWRAHFAMCFKCTQSQQHCPICRVAITQRTQKRIAKKKKKDTFRNRLRKSTARKALCPVVLPYLYRKKNMYQKG